MIQCDFCNLVVDARNPTRIADMGHSVAFLNLEQTYRGRCLVVPKQHYDDLLSMPKELFDELNAEMLKVAIAIKMVCSPDRMNFAILGNVISHIHWHIIPRYESDPNWGRPPWPVEARVSLSDAQYVELANLLRSALGRLM